MYLSGTKIFNNSYFSKDMVICGECVITRITLWNSNLTDFIHYHIHGIYFSRVGVSIALPDDQANLNDE